MLLGVKNNLPRLQILSKDQIDKIHEGTLKILDNTGVRIKSEQALNILKEGGCKVDEKEEMAWIPPNLVEDMIKKCPSSFEWHSARPDGKKYVKLEPGRVNYTISHSPTHIIDLDGIRRQATFHDVAEMTRLGDALPMLHIGGSGLSGTKEEIDEKLTLVTAAAGRFVETIHNTDKPIFVPPSGEEAADAFEFFNLIRGDIDGMIKKPCTWAWSNVVSPLTHDKTLTDYAVGFAMFGLPVLFCPEVMASATGPATLAGTLVQHNAEVLSGAVICQLTFEQYGAGDSRPPVVYGSASTIMDPKTAQIALGAPEAGLMNALTGQMAHHYGMPSRGTAGCTDSKLLDAQAGQEMAINALMASMAGINVIVDSFAGIGPGVQANSYAAMVMNNENLTSIARVLRGLEITDETLAIDVINDIGSKGQFLGHKHTLKHYRKEFFAPKLFDRTDFEIFEKNDQKDASQRAYEIAKTILEKHEPEPIDFDLHKKLNEIYLGVKKKYQKG